MISKRKYIEIYNLLDVSPINDDCGKLCNKICCETTAYDNLGIYLLPNEDCLFTKKEKWLTWEAQNAKDYHFPLSWKGTIYFIRCLGSCPREKRPIQCRTFPLAPHIDINGNFHIIWETLKLPYSCPLIERRWKLNPLFIKNTFIAWRELIKDKLIKDLVIFDSKERIISGADIISLKSD